MIQSPSELSYMKNFNHFPEIEYSQFKWNQIKQIASILQQSTILIKISFDLLYRFSNDIWYFDEFQTQ